MGLGRHSLVVCLPNMLPTRLRPAPCFFVAADPDRLQHDRCGGGHDLRAQVSGVDCIAACMGTIIKGTVFIIPTRSRRTSLSSCPLSCFPFPCRLPAPASYPRFFPLQGGPGPSEGDRGRGRWGSGLLLHQHAGPAHRPPRFHAGLLRGGERCSQWQGRCPSSSRRYLGLVSTAVAHARLAAVSCTTALPFALFAAAGRIVPIPPKLVMAVCQSVASSSASLLSPLATTRCPLPHRCSTSSRTLASP